jgi:hypothetical protein
VLVEVEMEGEVEVDLAEKVANMSATCCHDSQMSAHFA